MNYLNSEDAKIVLKKYDAKFHFNDYDFADVCLISFDIVDSTLYAIGEPLSPGHNFVDLFRIELSEYLATDFNCHSFKETLKDAIRKEQTVHISDLIEEDELEYLFDEVFEELREEVENEN